MDKKQISLLTLCDLSKAFDSVSHHILLEKLRRTSIDNFWFDDYLRERFQSVRLNSTQSRKTNVPHGVPQGSVLGPILFNIYVNGISQHLDNCILVQYADDTQFLHTGTPANLNTLITDAQNTLESAWKYVSENGLKLNAKKTQCIFIGTRQIPKIPDNTTLTFQNTIIKPSCPVKNIGVHFDNYMTFDAHLSKSQSYGHTHVYQQGQTLL